MNEITKGIYDEGRISIEYFVSLDNEVVYTTQDARDRDLFIAELRVRVKLLDQSALNTLGDIESPEIMAKKAPIKKHGPMAKIRNRVNTLEQRIDKLSKELKQRKAESDYVHVCDGDFLEAELKHTLHSVNKQFDNFLNKMKAMLDE